MLFDVRTQLYVGNYQTCINEAQKLQLDGLVAEERDILMYRAMVALGQHSTVRGEISGSSPTALQAIKHLATYLSRKSERPGVVTAFKKLQEDGISMNNPTVALMAATVFMYQGESEEALKCLHGSDSLENVALMIQILIQISRPDLARKELKRMQTLDDDSTLTQLATAWTDLATGGEKLQDAYYVFQELSDKYGGTPLLLNGQAAAHMMQGRYEDAEGCLLSAQEKNSNDPETLINLNVVAQRLGKPVETSQRYINQLKDGFPEHPFTLALEAKEREFDSAVAMLAS